MVMNGKEMIRAQNLVDQMALNDPYKAIIELTCLYEVTKALSSTLDIKKALREILEILSKRANMERGTITIFNPKTQELQIEVAKGLTNQARRRGRYRLGEGITGTVAATGEPIVVPRIGNDPRFLNKTRSRSGDEKEELSFICVPIRSEKEIIGALSVDRRYTDEKALEDDLRLLTIISGLIAQSVKKLQEANLERESLMEENRQLKMALQERFSFGKLIGKSTRMQEVFEMAHRVSKSNATILLRGESGTGKSLIARAIHFNSPRAKGPFVTVNCSALPESLVESELFGHERGAFTGALQTKKGRFELAHKGTIFLDEIGELPHAVQVKLLNVIQDREFQRVGGQKTIRCDVRIIAATNKDLERALEEGQFREDLYYRLNVFPIYIPPLRERKTDIILLAEHFLERFSSQNGRDIKRISQKALDLLVQYKWPGNVRELENCIERAVLICDDDTIRAHHLPPSIKALTGAGEHGSDRWSFKKRVAEFEKELILEALKETKGNQSKAAKLLGTTLRIINYKIQKYAIDPEEFKPLRKLA